MMYVRSLYLSISELTQNLKTGSLEKLYEPPKVQFSFETYGWMVLLIILILLLMYLIWRFIQKDRYRRIAIRNLEHLAKDNENSALGILILLKNLAMDVYGRESIAALNGEDWFSFLDARASSVDFSSMADSLNALVYKNIPLENEQRSSLFMYAKKWIRNHERKL
ncbi:DUF4381 domain-containing protein [Robertkochia solimangrovi]|uniref:DUF4381 domain-containing protein n=1 Tax=Robertkochia solimangrovi TaxID=2213046 RepID=UPI00117CCFA3|nr:DUF4381 domain-containing protein [Robertkochia solimangrovi]TRZ42008.1 hypothetical protein DMZ48_15340 [Robertkochia solimangrovi]